MAWTKIDEMYISRYTTLVVGGAMTIEQVPEKYRAEVQARVDACFTEQSRLQPLKQTTEI